jgi:hypothetical protein
MLRALLLLVFLSSTALGSTAVQLDVPALTHAASDVVRVRVLASEVRWTEDNRRLVTFVLVEVLDAWKGEANGRLTVLQPGGELDGVGQRVAGVATLGVGEEWVLFLERQGPLHRVLGLSQGAYRVQRPPDGSPPRAVPASVQGLRLLAAPGRRLEPLAPGLLESLKADVRREGKRR